MDKQLLNKEVVLMRKHAKKARVHVITKLLREANKLKNKNGSVEQKQKHQRKAQRLTEEVLAIKTFKDDDITKFALNETRKLETILGDVNVQLETKALAKVAANENISMHVIQFRKKYPSWKECVPSLLQNLGTKVKNKESGTRNKETQKRKKPTGISVKKLLDKRESNTSNHNRVDDCEQMEVGSAKDCKQTNSVVVDINHDQVIGTSCWLAVDVVNQVKKKKVPKQTLNSKKLPLIHGHKSTPLTRNAKNSKGINPNIAEVKRFTELLKNQSSTYELDNSNSGDSMTDVPTSIAEDPFFVSEGGNGLSNFTAGIDNLLSHQNSSENAFNANLIRKRDNKKQGPNRSERRQMLGISQSRQRNFKSSQHKTALKESCFIKTQGNVVKTKIKENNMQDKKPNSLKGPEGPVHPSWEAKRKLKEQQTTVVFQGKKIKFDE